MSMVAPGLKTSTLLTGFAHLLSAGLLFWRVVPCLAQMYPGQGVAVNPAGRTAAQALVYPAAACARAPACVQPGTPGSRSICTCPSSTSIAAMQHRRKKTSAAAAPRRRARAAVETAMPLPAAPLPLRRMCAATSGHRAATRNAAPSRRQAKPQFGEAEPPQRRARAATCAAIPRRDRSATDRGRRPSRP